MTIFEASFSTRYSILFSGSRDSNDIYKYVAIQRSLGTSELENSATVRSMTVSVPSLDIKGGRR